MNDEHSKSVAKTATIALELDYYLLEKLTHKADELSKTWNELINVAIDKLLKDIDFVRNLRK